MHRPRTEGRRGGMGEVSWAEGGWKMGRGMEGREGERGGPRAPPTHTGSHEEQEGRLSQKEGFSLLQDQPGQPGRARKQGASPSPVPGGGQASGDRVTAPCAPLPTACRCSSYSHLRTETTDDASA